jgi:DNA protecting protein DprA
MDTNKDANEYWKLETVAFYALQSLRGVGFKTLYNIASQGISFRELIKTNDCNYFQETLKYKLDKAISSSENEWQQLKISLWSHGVDLARKYHRENIYVVFRGQDVYPPQLKRIPNPPMWLFVQGPLANLHQKSIAIVGSRKATKNGVWLTKFIVASMAGLDLVSVSGLAEGIDQEAHLESIRYNIPTVAVLGTGIDSNYPKGSELVRAEILAHGGSIITEYLIGQSYSAENFVRRNRIQAALAKIVVPVEWNIKSGTAHTVNFAKEYGKALLMPYLPLTDTNSAELQVINSYPSGMIFQVPHQVDDLLSFLKSPKERATDTTTEDISKNQIILDI